MVFSTPQDNGATVKNVPCEPVMSTRAKLSGYSALAASIAASVSSMMVATPWVSLGVSVGAASVCIYVVSKRGHDDADTGDTKTITKRLSRPLPASMTHFLWLSVLLHLAVAGFSLANLNANRAPVHVLPASSQMEESDSFAPVPAAIVIEAQQAASSSGPFSLSRAAVSALSKADAGSIGDEHAFAPPSASTAAVATASVNEEKDAEAEDQVEEVLELRQTQATNCAPGYKLVGGATCEQCPPGHYTLNNVDPECRPQLCGPGFYVTDVNKVDGKSECDFCPEGTFNLETDALPCEPYNCPAGTQAANRESGDEPGVCVPCDGNRFYNDVAGNGKCKRKMECFGASLWNRDTAFTPNPVSPGDCDTWCPVGSFSEYNENVCTPFRSCPSVNEFIFNLPTDGGTRTLCHWCPEGTLALNPGDTECSTAGASPIVSLISTEKSVCSVSKEDVRCWTSAPLNNPAAGATVAAAAPVLPNAVNLVPDVLLAPAAGQTTSLTVTSASVFANNSGCVMMETRDATDNSLISSQPRCWGHGQTNRLGNGNTNQVVTNPRVMTVAPTALAGMLRNVDVMTTTSSAGCVLTKDTQVACWGMPTHKGATNNPVFEVVKFGATAATPAAGATTGVTDLASVQTNSCAIVAGRVWCWGTSVSTRFPLAVSPAASTAVKLVSLKVKSICAIFADGAIGCFDFSATATATGGVWTSLPFTDATDAVGDDSKMCVHLSTSDIWACRGVDAGLHRVESSLASLPAGWTHVPQLSGLTDVVTFGTGFCGLRFHHTLHIDKWRPWCMFETPELPGSSPSLGGYIELFNPGSRETCPSGFAQLPGPYFGCARLPLEGCSALERPVGYINDSGESAAGCLPCVWNAATSSCTNEVLSCPAGFIAKPAVPVPVGQVRKATCEACPAGTTSTGVRGDNKCYKLESVRMMASSDWHVCVTLYGGDVWCWGFLADEPLGSIVSGDQAFLPRLVEGALPRNPDGSPAASPVGRQAFNMDTHTTCVVYSNGPRCWGVNDEGQIGTGAVGSQIAPITPFATTRVPHASPTAPLSESAFWLPGLKSSGLAKKVVSSRISTFVLTDLGLVYEFGRGAVTAPRLVRFEDGRPLSDVTDISSNQQVTCAIADSIFYCWGDNSTGGMNFANSFMLDPVYPYPTPMLFQFTFSPITKIFAHGLSRTCAISLSLGLTCWGQLGETTYNGVTYEVPVLLNIPYKSQSPYPYVDAMMLPHSVVGSSTDECVRYGMAEPFRYACAGLNRNGVWQETTEEATPSFDIHKTTYRFDQYTDIRLSKNTACGIRRPEFRANGAEVDCWGFNSAGTLGRLATSLSFPKRVFPPKV